eukprot:2887028-Pyramimonas_sp.AAC.1
MAMISVYLEDSIGLQGPNRQLLEEVHSWCAHLDVPVIIGGDWNIEASELSTSGWPELMGG